MLQTLFKVTTKHTVSFNIAKSSNLWGTVITHCLLHIAAMFAVKYLAKIRHLLWAPTVRIILTVLHHLIQVVKVHFLCLVVRCIFFSCNHFTGLDSILLYNMMLRMEVFINCNWEWRYNSWLSLTNIRVWQYWFSWLILCGVSRHAVHATSNY